MYRNVFTDRRLWNMCWTTYNWVWIHVFLAMLFVGCATTTKTSRYDELRGTIDGDNCVWAFHSYEPSSWEMEWRRGEESGERRDQECEVLAQPEEVNRSVQLITAIYDVVKLGKPAPPPESIDLFSRMIYARRCGEKREDTWQRRVQLIEPLVGILRDPLTICPQPGGVDKQIYNLFGLGENAIQSKRHFLLGPLAPWTDTPNDPGSWRVGGFDPWGASAVGHRQPCVRLNVLMDIGASLYDRWGGDTAAASTRWFVERFKQRQLAFDWIVSFEIEKHDPDDIYRNVPDDVLPHYLYFTRRGELSKWQMEPLAHPARYEREA